MGELPRIDEPQLMAYYDEDTQLIRCAYRQVLEQDLTLRFYQWRADLLQKIDVKSVRGTIVDFTEVTQFPALNIVTVFRQSRDANTEIDMSHIPVAYIVATPEQEYSVKLSMQVTPQASRRRIVISEQAALAFIDEWHLSHH